MTEPQQVPQVPENYKAAMLSPAEQLERDIEATLWMVLELGGVTDAERAHCGARIARQLLVQLFRERPDALQSLLDAVSVGGEAT